MAFPAFPNIPGTLGTSKHSLAFPGLGNVQMTRDDLIESWAQRRSSLQVYAEIVLADALGHQPGDPSPLEGWLPPWPDPKPPSKPKPRSGLLPQHLIDQAKATNILEASTRLGLGDPVKLSANEYSVLCPFHDDTRPSLNMNPAKNVWSCLVCGNRGGDVISLVEQLLNCGFRQAISWLLGHPTAPPKRRLAG